MLTLRFVYFVHRILTRLKLKEINNLYVSLPTTVRLPLQLQTLFTFFSSVGPRIKVVEYWKILLLLFYCMHIHNSVREITITVNKVLKIKATTYLSSLNICHLDQIHCAPAQVLDSQ